MQTCPAERIVKRFKPTLISEKNGKLPEALKVKDNNLKVSKTFVRERLGSTAAIAIIYTKEAAELLGGRVSPLVLGVDYSKKEQITSRYEYKVYELAEINC